MTTHEALLPTAWLPNFEERSSLWQKNVEYRWARSFRGFASFRIRWTSWVVLVVAFWTAFGSVAQPGDQAEMLTLNARIAELYRAGKYAEAVPFAQRHLQLSEKTRGPNHPATVDSINNLATLYESTGEYAKAASLFQRALIIVEKAPAPNEAATATVLNNMATLYEKTGDYAKAAPLYERALAINERVLGPNNPDTNTYASNLAELYGKMGEYAKAKSLLQRALQTSETVFGLWHLNTANCANNLGGIYWEMGDYSKAEPLFRRTLDIRQKLLGPEHPDTALSVNLLAGLYLAMGNLSKAEPLFRNALATREKLLGPEHPDTIISVNNLAALYEKMGDHAKAEPLYQRALAIDTKTLGPNHPNTIAILNNLAALYLAIGDAAKAEPLFRRVLETREKALGSEHPDSAASRNNLASLYQVMGDQTKAEPLFRRALEISERALGLNHPDTATCANNLAALYVEMGDYSKARPLLERSLAIRERTLGALHVDTAAACSNLASLEQKMGNYAKAEPLFRRALSVTEKVFGPGHPDTATVLENLAMSELKLGEVDASSEVANRAMTAKELVLSEILSFTPEQERLAFERTLNPFTLPAVFGRGPDIAQAVLRMKGVVLDSLLEDRLVAEASQNAKIRAMVNQVSAAKERLTQMLMDPPVDSSDKSVQQRHSELDARTGEVEQLEASLARNVAGLGKVRRALTVTVSQVQGALSHDQVVVELFRHSHYFGEDKFEDRYGAVVISSTGTPRWIPLGPVTEIEKNALVYERSVRGERDEMTLRTTLRALYDQLWAPIDDALPPGINTVVLSPDGDLNFISFATLTTPDDHFLAEKYSIQYVASGRDLLWKIKPSANHLVVAFGNPDFAAPVNFVPRRASTPTSTAPRTLEPRDFSHIILPPLPGTAGECAALKQQMKASGSETRAFLGADATEAQLRQVKSPHILHLATHGFFLPETKDPRAGKDRNSTGLQSFGTRADAQGRQILLKNPMHRSGLALSGAQRTLDAWARGEAPPTDNDGIVTAEEVGGLNLQGTWLVTLSACDTGTGEARAGEGVMGLRRGFIQAGAQNLLMTLWAISDDTTVEIMKDFYARALKTGNAPQALADTQREWLVKLRKEKGLAEAVTLAGAFIMSSQGKP